MVGFMVSIMELPLYIKVMLGVVIVVSVVFYIILLKILFTKEIRDEDKFKSYLDKREHQRKREAEE